MLAIAFLFICSCIPAESVIHPIVLVPGDGGNKLEAKLDKESVIHYLCQKKTDDYFVLWLNVKLLVPVVMHCWMDNMRLIYNTSTRTSENSPGVSTRVPGFGNTSCVENVEASHASIGNYFKAIVEESLIPIGYKRNMSIRGAPYDFRKAPNELQSWMRDLKKLIEDTYILNEKLPIILMSHSMGSPLVLYFLHHQKSKWKKKYIRAIISLAGVWGGSVKAVKVILSGDNLGSYVLSTSLIREEQKSFPSTMWLLPNKNFWSEEENLVVINGKRNFTTKNYEQLFRDMNYTDGYEMYKDTVNLVNTLRPPGVDTYCIHGTGVSTVESLIYKTAGRFPQKPDFTYGNGDGTVNIRSLRGCTRWFHDHDEYNDQPNRVGKNRRRRLKLESAFGKKDQKVEHKEFSGLDHMTILSDPSVLNYVQTTVLRINDVI